MTTTQWAELHRWIVSRNRAHRYGCVRTGCGYLVYLLKADCGVTK